MHPSKTSIPARPSNVTRSGCMFPTDLLPFNLSRLKGSTVHARRHQARLSRVAAKTIRLEVQDVNSDNFALYGQVSQTL